MKNNKLGNKLKAPFSLVAYQEHRNNKVTIILWHYFPKSFSQPKPLCVALDARRTESRAVLGPGNVSDGAEQNLHPLQTFTATLCFSDFACDCKDFMPKLDISNAFLHGVQYT